MRTRVVASMLLALVVLSPVIMGKGTTETVTVRTVQLHIPAVGQAANGSFFGVASTLNLTMQTPGAGRVFVSVQPLTQVDMQGSARLAVRTASALTGLDTDASDFFFSVHAPTSNVGGPSAGGAMAVAVVALLEGWDLDPNVVMTGMINPDASIGPIGGVLEKVDAVASVGGTRFLIPLGQSIVMVTRTETTQNGPFVQTTTRQEPVDVRAYARDTYGITVDEVADLYDVVEPFTGHRLVRPTPTTDPLKDAAYQAITRRLGESTVEDASRRLDQVGSHYESVKPAMGTADRQEVEGQLATAAARLNEARDAHNATRDYLAASSGFQSLVAIEYAAAFVNCFDDGCPDAAVYTRAYLNTTQTVIEGVDVTLDLDFPLAVARLDAEAAAEQRILDAQAAQAQAVAEAGQEINADALRDSSFARQRAQSATWWHDIGLEVSRQGSGPMIQESQFHALIARYTEIAQLELEYGAYIVPDQPMFQQAQQDFLDSQTAFEADRPAAGLFDLVEAFAHVSTALVAPGGPQPVAQRLPDLEAGAAYQIEWARAQGAPPVFASSLLELGRAQAETSPTLAYASYSLARLAAGSGLAAAGIKNPPPEIVGGTNATPREFFTGPVAIAFLVGAGLVVLVVVGLVTLRRRPALSPPRQVAYAPPPPPPAAAAPPPPPPPPPVRTLPRVRAPIVAAPRARAPVRPRVAPTRTRRPRSR